MGESAARATKTNWWQCQGQGVVLFVVSSKDNFMNGAPKNTIFKAVEINHGL